MCEVQLRPQTELALSRPWYRDGLVSEQQVAATALLIREVDILEVAWLVHVDPVGLNSHFTLVMLAAVVVVGLEEDFSAARAQFRSHIARLGLLNLAQRADAVGMNGDWLRRISLPVLAHHNRSRTSLLQQLDSFRQLMED